MERQLGARVLLRKMMGVVVAMTVIFVMLATAAITVDNEGLRAFAPERRIWSGAMVSALIMIAFSTPMLAQPGFSVQSSEQAPEISLHAADAILQQALLLLQLFDFLVLFLYVFLCDLKLFASVIISQLFILFVLIATFLLVHVAQLSRLLSYTTLIASYRGIELLITGS